MKYKERDRIVGQLRELADFIEAHGVQLPSAYVTTTCSLYLTSTDYVKNPVSGEYESVLNEAQTKENLKRALDTLGSCEKDYRDDRITIEKKFSDGSGNTMVRATVDRSLACKKVKTGQKLVPAVFKQAEVVDEFEWQCDEGLSLRALVSDL